jgi:hypothetical protein
MGTWITHYLTVIGFEEFCEPSQQTSWYLNQMRDEVPGPPLVMLSFYFHQKKKGTIERTGGILLEAFYTCQDIAPNKDWKNLCRESPLGRLAHRRIRPGWTERSIQNGVAFLMEDFDKKFWTWIQEARFKLFLAHFRQAFEEYHIFDLDLGPFPPWWNLAQWSTYQGISEHFMKRTHDACYWYAVKEEKEDAFWYCRKMSSFNPNTQLPY